MVLLAFGLCFLAFSGCSLFDSYRRPRIEESPPYYHTPQDRFTSDMRSMHDRDRENMASDLKVFRNKEMAKLEQEIVEEEKDREWEEDYQATIRRREKMNPANWFKSKGNDRTFMRSEEAARISDNLER